MMSAIRKVWMPGNAANTPATIPLGLTRRDLSGPVTALRGGPQRRSQSLRVVSTLPESARRPSGLKATDWTQS